jgi:hypothetical protein
VNVDPDIAILKRDDTLVWLVMGPEGYTSEVDFHAQDGKKGPFPRTPVSARNPVRGRYYLKGGENFRTQNPDRKGYWKYDVKVWDPSGEQVGCKDPGVLIRNG